MKTEAETTTEAAARTLTLLMVPAHLVEALIANRVTAGDSQALWQLVRKELTRKPKKAKRLSRSQRWGDAANRAKQAVEELVDLQGEYSEWRDGLPENLQGSPVGEKLDAVCDLDLDGCSSTLDECEGAELPQGFGRD